MELDNLSQFFDDRVKASLAIAQLAQLDEYGPGKALVELAKGIEAKLEQQNVDSPCFDLNQPKKHILFKLGIIKGMQLLTEQAPKMAKQLVNESE